MLTFRSCRNVKITADPNMNWTIDGEMELGREKILVENLHQVIRVVGGSQPKSEEAEK